MAALLLWATDLFFCVPERMHVALASLFFLLLLLLPLSLAFGLFFRVVLDRGNPYWSLERVVTRSWDVAWTRDPAAGFRLLVETLGGLLYAGAAAGAAYLICRELAVEIVRPRYQAILSVVATVGSFAALVPLFLFARAVGRRWSERAAGIPVLSAAWSRPGIPVVGTVVAVLGAGIGFLLVFAEAVKAAPWQTPAVLVLAILAALPIGAIVCRLYERPVVAWAFAALVVVLVLSGSAAACLLGTRDVKARQYFGSTRGVRQAYRLLVRMLDDDGDGFMHQFAGGDCAPDDPERSPVAIDVPGNGVDEDCDGKDVTFALLKKGRWDYPVPSSFPKRPLPVFLITSDALSANHMPYLGYERNVAPNVAALAKRCVAFEKAFSQGPSTRLSLASAFTGMYDSQVERGEGRKVPYPFLSENTTLAEAFQAKGYDTVAVMPNAYFYKRWKGILQGFETVDKSAAKTRKKKGKPVHNAHKMTKAALKHLAARRTKPLFMWVHYYDNHPPFGQPKGVRKFGRTRRDKYDAEVLFFDRHVQPLLKEIERKYGKKGYLLVFSSDHGSSFDKNHPKRSHGYDLHTSVLHIPLFFCSPALAPRWVRRTPVTLLDVFPTLVNLLGLKNDVELEGTSLVPLLFEDLEWEDRVIFHQFYLIEKVRKGLDPLFAAAVRTGQHNFIWDRDEDRYLLFDYDNDRFEKSDLYESEPGLVHDLDSILKTWLHRVHRKHRRSLKRDGAPDDGGMDDDYSVQY